MFCGETKGFCLFRQIYPQMLVQATSFHSYVLLSCSLMRDPGQRVDIVLQSGWTFNMQHNWQVISATTNGFTNTHYADSEFGMFSVFFFFFLTNHCNDFRVQRISNWTVLFMSNILKSVYVKAKVCKLKYLLVSHLNIQREPKVGLFVNSSSQNHSGIGLNLSSSGVNN